MAIKTTYCLGSLLLAAGESRRFAGIKQLAQLQGDGMLERALTVLSELDCSVKRLAIGANADTILKQITLPDDVKCITVPNWRSGIAASINAGVGSLNHCSHILILLADQPDIRVQDLNQLIKQSQEAPDKIVCSYYFSRNAVPAIFPASYYDLLLSLTGDKGASVFLNQSTFQQQILAMPMPRGQIDIDTQQDLCHWQQQEG